MRRFSILECIQVFCGNFIERCSAAESKLNLECGSSNASSNHLPLPELFERLEKYARRQPSPMFESCFPPTDDTSSENRKRDFIRNIVTSMIKIYGINKKDEARGVSYTASNRKGVGYFTGIKFYDAVIPALPTHPSRTSRSPTCLSNACAPRRWRGIASI
jgi:hypothetical protein